MCSTALNITVSVAAASNSILTRTVEELAPEGGLVLVPSLDDLGIQAHQGIANAVHGSGGVAFSRGKMLD